MEAVVKFNITDCEEQDLSLDDYAKGKLHNLYLCHSKLDSESIRDTKQYILQGMRLDSESSSE